MFKVTKRTKPQIPLIEYQLPNIVLLREAPARHLQPVEGTEQRPRNWFALIGLIGLVDILILLDSL
jgi:hypothetical protein